jgi:TPR repeat protein
LLIAALVAVPNALAGTLENALAMLDQQRYADAYAILQPMASAGDAEAQFLIGNLIIDRHIDGVDQEKGVHWLEQAVEQRHVAAAQSLSKMYLSGYVVQFDAARGAEYQSLANQFRLPAENVEECD